jgi:WW domain-binding protein 11
MRLLQEEEPEHWSEVKRKEVEYEKRRYKRVQYYESVRHAEQVSIEDIPLPSSTNEKPIPATMPKINLPPPVLLTNVPAPSTQRKPEDILGNSEQNKESKEKEPPGIPASMPPNIFEMRELDSDYESDGQEEVDEESGKEESSKDKHDKNIEEFMKEVESAQRKKEEERAIVTTEIKVNPTPDIELEEKSDAPEETIKVNEEIIPMPSQQQQPQPHIPIGMPRMPPHAIMFRPPPMRPGLPIGIRMPPGPPPAHLRPNVGMPRMGIRMAPGPPPRHKHHHDRNAPPKQTTTTITAKPQIRNLSADVTRFVPTTLRAAKRDEPRRVKPKPYMQDIGHMQHAPSVARTQQPSKDDAYKQFMEELGELL